MNNPSLDTTDIRHRHRHLGGMSRKTPPPTELQIPATVTTLPVSTNSLSYSVRHYRYNRVKVKRKVWGTYIAWFYSLNSYKVLRVLLPHHLLHFPHFVDCDVVLTLKNHLMYLRFLLLHVHFVSCFRTYAHMCIAHHLHFWITMSWGLGTVTAANHY